MKQLDAGRIADRLTEVFQDQETETETLDLDNARLVVFSDQHRGEGDPADDFALCKRAYHAALGYYLESGYRLCVLGDVEDLWECFPKPVIRQYLDTLELEREFHDAGRYRRVFGNHDDLWAHADQVDRYLAPIFKGLKVRQALKYRVTRGTQHLGTLFLVHGHQGTSDEHKARLHKWFVRHVWWKIQRITGVRIQSPAKDFSMRGAHERAMYDWSKVTPKTVLIAGHTHRPVFQSRVNTTRLAHMLEEARARLKAKPGDPTLLAAVAELRAELEWAQVVDGAFVGESTPKPCYFNTGCCCFDDGDCTGIEVANGEIRLVRWPDNAGDARAQVLDSTNLAGVFDKL